MRFSSFRSKGLWSARLLTIYKALALIGLVVLPALAEDWPTYQNDARRSGMSGAPLNLSKLEASWVYQSPNPPQTAWAGPAKWDAYAGIRGLASMRNYDPVFHTIQVGDAVYFGSTADDSVHCLDQATGAVRWTFTTDAPIRIAPSYWEGRIYFGSDDGFAYCLDAESGELIWKFSPKPESRKTLNNGRMISYYPCRTGVLVDDNGLAYFAMSLAPWKESYLCALDAKTGSQEVPGAFIQRMESVTLEGALLASADKIIAPQGRIAPLLFDKTNGKALGSLQGGGGCFVLLTPESEILHGPGNKTGWVQSSKESDQTKIATYQGGKAMIVRGSFGYLMKDDGIDAFDRVAKTPLWSASLEAPLTIILTGAQLWVGERDQVTCLDAITGKEMKRFKVEGRVYGLSAANGYLMASTDTGAIYAYSDSSNQPGAQIADISSSAANSDSFTLWELNQLNHGGAKDNGSAEDSPKEKPLPQIAAIDEPGLVSRWVFQSNNTAGRKIPNLAEGMDATLIGKPIWERVLDWEALVFDGSENSVLVTMDLQAKDLPVETVTAEAWVKVDAGLSWGGLIGALQDNGAYEKGWLLGYMDNYFSFAVNGATGPDKLMYLKANKPFELGSWAHVAGVYDGESTKLFMNGELVAESKEQQGAIQYPPTAFLEIGAYHDQDEHYRLQGAMREARLYHRALSQEEIQQHAAIYPFPVVEREVFGALAAGPWIQWESTTSAKVSWETAEMIPTEITLTAENDVERVFQISTPLKKHSIVVNGLGRNRVYEFQILTGYQDQKPIRCEVLELDTFFNFSLSKIDPAKQPESWKTGDSGSEDGAVKWKEKIETILGASQSTKGVALQWGLSQPAGRLAYEMAQRSDYRVIVIDSDIQAVRTARRDLIQAGVYGSRVAVHYVPEGSVPNFVGLFANVIYSGQEQDAQPFPVNLETAFAYLKPEGGKIVFDIDSESRDAWERDWNTPWKLASTQYPRPYPGSWNLTPAGDPTRFEYQRGSLHGAGVWSHQYGDATGSAFAGETLSGAKGADELEIQWMGRPGPRAQPDRNGRKPAPLSFNGRLFVQGLQRIIALDAYNGSVLWTWELPRLGRFNMPRDSGNWSANSDSVFAAIDHEVWRFDAATGALVHRYATPEGKRTDWDYDWGYLAAEENQILGSRIKRGSTFKEFWGGSGAGWYDATSGPVTEKVSGESVYAMDLETGEVRWERNRGWALHSGIAFGEDEIYIAEMRHPKVLGLETSRVGIPEMWEDLWLVALNRQTGEELWEKKIETPPGQVAFTVAYAEGSVVVNASGEGSYYARTFAAESGELLWEKTVKWPQNHHGGHMARPAIVNGVVYIRPAALDLATGSELDIAMPGGGCGTYAASSNALFFRSGNVTVWDRDAGKTTSWERLRPDCWLSSIPAAGLLLSPEAGGGCSCGSWMETSVAFVPNSLLPRIP